MDRVLTDGIDFFFLQTGSGLLALYWYVVVFEIPRYALGFAVVALLPLRPGAEAAQPKGRLSVAVVGHNEADKIEHCIQALHEQSRPPDEIIVVSDGSTDDMRKVLGDLLHQKKITAAHSTDLRAGKSAAVNLAERHADAAFIAVVDCDCSFDRHAFRTALQYLSDPKVGAVSGNILVRNERTSLTAAVQAMEYLVSISLGRQAADMFGLVSCISGAFGVFRSTALAEVGGMDAGGGEDLDLTLRLRKEGWQVRFAADALCYTDVPATPDGLFRQRFRWERDSVRLRYRKHVDMMNPFSRKFRTVELLHEIEFLFFNVIGAAALPLYLIWLFVNTGTVGLVVLLGAQVGMILLDFVIVMLAAHATPENRSSSLMPYIPAYSIFNGIFLRFIRLAAYAQEWVFYTSYSDTYCPEKVQMERL